MAASHADTQQQPADLAQKPTHPPLERTRQQIRLLSFCTPEGEGIDAPGRGIRCSLSVADLADGPQFTALSYVWGPQDDGYEITLNDYSYRVRANLFAALQSIAKHLGVDRKDRNTDASGSSLSKYFWIDAICINQDDIDERNRQVQMMSTIYKSASLVLVWLGRECGEALRAIQTADPAHVAILQDTRGSYEIPDDEAVKWYQSQDNALSRGIVPLLKATYWDRMWVLQEFILGRDLVLASGDVLLTWEDARPMFSAYKITENPEYHHPVRMAAERQMRVGGYEFQKIEYRLADLVRNFGGMKCVDPRDRIFALLGLVEGLKTESPNSEEARLYVDYRLTPLQLAARYLTIAAKAASEQDSAWFKIEGVGVLFGYLPRALGIEQSDLKAELRRLRSESKDGCWLGYPIREVFKALFDCEIADMYAEKGWLPGNMQLEYSSDTELI